MDCTRIKSIISNPKTVEVEMLEGMRFAYPGLFIDAKCGVVLVNKDRKDRVALVCGSGAGYEPYAAGFVGEGMLTGYISGKVRKPPRTNVILSVFKMLTELNKGGILVLILNYPREILNFGLAVERARALGLRVETVVLVDDCSRWKAMRNEHYTNLAYKKGLSGCVFSFKILGALSTAGASMSYLISEARALNFRTTTLGFCMEPYFLPGSLQRSFAISPGEVVIGLGINGENGIKVLRDPTTEDVIKTIVPIIYEESNLNHKSSVVILINSLSSLTAIESYIIAKEVNRFIAKKKVTILRQMVGRFLTAFDAKGAHISILNVSDKEEEWMKYFDMETEAYAWPNMKLCDINPNLELQPYCYETGPEPRSRGGMELIKRERDVFRKCVEAACNALIDAEIVLNALNEYTGNGDCGTKLKTFANAVLEMLPALPVKDISIAFQKFERCAEETMTGNIGSVYAAMLCGASFQANSWAKCFMGALQFLGAHYPIVSNCRTLFDALKPACYEFVENIDLLGMDFWRAALQLSVDAAEKGCYQTSKMKPKVGVYHLDGEMNMDAGAFSVVVWMRAINEVLKELLPLGISSPEDDWHHKLQALLISQRASQRISPVQYKEEIKHMHWDLTDVDVEEEESVDMKG